MTNKTKSWLLLIVLAIIWGSSFILMKKAMVDDEHNHYLAPPQVASLRIFIAALAISPFAIRAVKFITKKNIVFFILVGLLGNLIPAFLFTYAESSLSSSFTGVLNSLVPIFAALVSFFVFKNHISKLSAIGVGLGFLGTFFLILFKESDFSKIDVGATMLVVLATVCYAFSLNIIKEKLTEVDSVSIASFSLFVMILPSGFLALHFNSFDNLFTPEFRYPFIYMLVLSVIGTAFALIIFNNLIKLSSAVFASSVTYLIPIVALIWGVVFGEHISWSIVFVSVIVVGIYLVRKGNKANEMPMMDNTIIEQHQLP